MESFETKLRSSCQVPAYAEEDPVQLGTPASGVRLQGPGAPSITVHPFSSVEYVHSFGSESQTIWQMPSRLVPPIWTHPHMGGPTGQHSTPASCSPVSATPTSVPTL